MEILRRLLVIYDLSNVKRRRELVKSLESYGKRVQESAFEMNLKSYEKKRMLKEIKGIIDVNNDNVRIYDISSNVVPEIIGIDSSPVNKKILYNFLKKRNFLKEYTINIVKEKVDYLKWARGKAHIE